MFILRLLINTPLQRGVPSQPELKTVSTVFHRAKKPLKRFQSHADV